MTNVGADDPVRPSRKIAFARQTHGHTGRSMTNAGADDPVRPPNWSLLCRIHIDFTASPAHWIASRTDARALSRLRALAMTDCGAFPLSSLRALTHTKSYSVNARSDPAVSRRVVFERANSERFDSVGFINYWKSSVRRADRVIRPYRTRRRADRVSAHTGRQLNAPADTAASRVYSRIPVHLFILYE